MNPAAIAKLRRTFIAIATGTFFAVIMLMGVGSFLANISTMLRQAESTIDAIIDAGGNLPESMDFDDTPFREEAAYGLRYFSVTIDQDKNIVDVNLKHVASVDYAEALKATEAALKAPTFTSVHEYERYLYKQADLPNGNSIIVFVDYSIQLQIIGESSFMTMLIDIGAFFIIFICVLVFSKRAIRPEVESARRQQRFMTNASHELKTPIAVIRANTELTEMMSGETEWTQSTMRQVDRLDDLVHKLMLIVRGIEKGSSERSFEEADITSIVSAAADPFASVASQQGVKLDVSCADGVRIVCSPSSIEQLTYLLVDNAVKYCDDGGTVSVKLVPSLIGRGCTLAVSNDYKAGANVDYRRFFDRFYRADEAHENQQGYGIGLSVAESICKSHHGSIKVTWKAGVITFTCVLKDAQ